MTVHGADARDVAHEGGVDQAGEVSGNEAMFAGGEVGGKGVVEGEKVGIQRKDGGVGILGWVVEEIGG